MEGPPKFFSHTVLYKLAYCPKHLDTLQRATRGGRRQKTKNQEKPSIYKKTTPIPDLH
jgi:hypothetical protein